MNKSNINGSRFETDFKDSVPFSVHSRRIRNSTAAWGGGTITRFQISEISDFMLFDGSTLLYAELKHSAVKRIDSSRIKTSQYKQMISASSFPNVICCVIAKFTDVKSAYLLDINLFCRYLTANKSKSVPLAYFKANGVEITSVQKANGRFWYDIQKMMVDIKK
jgi:penicillin-binding protein-related factor A (putative recombinase)